MAYNPGEVTPLEGEDFNSYYNRVGNLTVNGWSNVNPYGFLGNINNFLTGDRDSALEVYRNWYNSQSAANQARADYEYDRMLRMTEYQDMIKSMQDAGLNPYVLLANGANASGAQSISTTPSKFADREKSSSKTAFIALIYAIGRIMASIL